jgi:formate dehydrogenase major subunit
MTNSWTDIKNADLVLVMGGNAAEAHPCGFKWVVEAQQQRKAKLIVVDPRFTRPSGWVLTSPSWAALSTTC